MNGAQANRTKALDAGPNSNMHSRLADGQADPEALSDVSRSIKRALSTEAPR